MLIYVAGIVIQFWIYDSEEASLGTLAQMKFPIMVTFSFTAIFLKLRVSYSCRIIYHYYVCTVLSQQDIWRENNWDNYFGADSSQGVLFSVNRFVIRTSLLCLSILKVPSLNKESKYSYINFWFIVDN